MMETSYFAAVKKMSPEDRARCVSISQGVPKWYLGRQYKALAPSWAMIRLTDQGAYCQGYAGVLAGLDAKEVVADLGPDAILLCWEKPGEFCHRRLVADWIKTKTGQDVPEYGRRYEYPENH